MSETGAGCSLTPRPDSDSDQRDFVFSSVPVILDMTFFFINILNENTGFIFN